ncbi:hypothetical protein K439DRAFT_1643511 [Ramaria rubella]|nr:hypothetical protein K439DRAFT_1643511 [Ramaria rubella]
MILKDWRRLSPPPDAVPVAHWQPSTASVPSPHPYPSPLHTHTPPLSPLHTPMPSPSPLATRTPLPSPFTPPASSVVYIEDRGGQPALQHRQIGQSIHKCHGKGVTC